MPNFHEEKGLPETDLCVCVWPGLLEDTALDCWRLWRLLETLETAGDCWTYKANKYKVGED